MACAAIPITIGYLVDAIGGTELTMFFSVMFFIGCVAAALVIQNKSLFTAMVQPPLLLIIAVPLAYKTFAVGPTQGLKSLVLDMALPLIDRFPTMAFTTLVVWVIGAFRLTLFIQERRGKQNASGRRRTARTEKPSSRETVSASATSDRQESTRPAPPRQSAARPSAASATPRPAAARSANVPPNTRTRRPAPRTPADDPQIPAEPARGVRRPAPQPARQQDSRSSDRQQRPHGDEVPRTRSARGHRYADEPQQPAAPAQPAQQRRRSEAPRRSTPPPAPDEPTTGRRRLRQESVREFAERQGEVPRYRANPPAKPRPDKVDPDAKSDYPRLPNVRYRD